MNFLGNPYIKSCVPRILRLREAFLWVSRKLVLIIIYTIPKKAREEIIHQQFNITYLQN